ncbi:MAG: transaldolase [Chlamydiia bacterium]|nr:transaldolase [Chlamydiia bacterium]
MNSLEQLKTFSTVVADTGNLDEIAQYTPQDATTNPTLILKAIQNQKYDEVVKQIQRDEGANCSEESILEALLVGFGAKILELIPGRVSTEVDAHLAFDTDRSVEMARRLISRYERLGYGRERVLIKLPATWEGVLAAQVLEKEQIHCNMTLIFCSTQAVACAQVGATLISPFVGRILDWYLAHGKEGSYSPENDPGVKSVKAIYQIFKSAGYSTQIMGASFRNSGEVLALAGCDLLTISPQLLKEIQDSKGGVERQLTPGERPAPSNEVPEAIEASQFRFLINEDAMASDKLADGIRRFAADTREMLKIALN